MAFTDFAKTQYIKTIDTSEEVRLGSFQVQDNIYLKYIRLTLYISGAVPTNEKIKIDLYSERTYNNALYSSDWTYLSQITGVADGWLGWLRFDFDSVPINKYITYYPKAVTSNYTRSSSYFLGLSYDFPYPIYDNSENFFYDHPIQMQIFGYNT